MASRDKTASRFASCHATSFLKSPTLANLGRESEWNVALFVQG